MKNVMQTENGVFYFDNTKVDLREASLPTDHPLMVCCSDSPQFKQVLIEMAESSDSNSYLMRDVTGFAVSNIDDDQ